MRRTLLAGGIALLGTTVGLVAAPAAGAATFSNTTPIAIPARGLAAVYPSSIAVGGIGKPLTDVNVRLNGFSHPNPGDVGVALVGPSGGAIAVMDCVGGSADAAGVNVSFDDSAPAFAPNNSTLASPAYKPTNHCPATTLFTAPGPEDGYSNPGPSLGGTSTLASVFGGTPADGVWNLYVLDGADNNGGQIAGGWTLEIQPDPSPAVPVQPSTGTKKKCKKPRKKAKKGAAAAKKKGCKKPKKK